MKNTSATLSGLTTEERFKVAIHVVKSQIRLRQNVIACCNACITFEQLGLSATSYIDTPSAYNFAGQDRAFSWSGGEAFNRQALNKIKRGNYFGFGLDYRMFKARTTRVYYNHSGPGVEAATVLRDAFTQFGFTVDWDGTDSKAVVVNMPVAMRPVR